MAKIRIIENTSEIAAGTRGSGLGTDAVKVASLNKKSNYFKKHLKETVRIKDLNHMLFEDDKSIYAKRIKGLPIIFERVSDVIRKTLKDDFFPLIIGGDHSSAGGTISGIKMAYPEKKLGIVWIDAHADLHSPYTTPSGNMHGMPLAIALATDNKEHQINTPEKETIEYWEKLKHFGNISPKVAAPDIVFISLRDFEAAEGAYIKKHGFLEISTEEVRKEGAEKAVTKTLHHLKNCDLIYISFDVDSMDYEKVSKGTGTPVAKGLYPTEVETILNGLAQDTKTVALEVVEINPCLDNKGNLMAETAFDLIESFSTYIEKR